jgi:hypothetical protein
MQRLPSSAPQVVLASDVGPGIETRATSNRRLLVGVGEESRTRLAQDARHVDWSESFQ